MNIVFANQIYMGKETLTPALLNGLVRIAAFQNPEFYKMQSLRKSVWKIPRIITCAENFPKHIALPRGCLDEVIELLENLGIKATIKDERFKGNSIKVKFNGKLYPEQSNSAKKMLKHDSGILAATTAFGKTIIAISMLAERGVNTLIISTGRYLGEGFDDANLDTLFLALPISWKGLLAQYAGRLHRLHDRKKVVLIYDYADINVPMLSRMYQKRRKGYRAIGYEA